MEDVVRRCVFWSLLWYLASSRISVLVGLVLGGCLVSTLALGIAFGIYVGLEGAFLERFVFLLRQLDGSLILETLPLLLADAMHLVQLLPPRLLTLDLLGLLELRLADVSLQIELLGAIALRCEAFSFATSNRLLAGLLLVGERHVGRALTRHRLLIRLRAS